MAQSITIKKTKKRRRFIAFCGIICLCLIILFFVFQKKEYTITYQIEDFQVEETYHKEKNYYEFLITKNNQSYISVQLNRHFTSKKLIYNIDEFTTENETCIELSSNKIRFIPLCSRDNKQISVNLTSEEMRQKLNFEPSTFGEQTAEQVFNINVSNYLYHNFYIWNYKGFYHLSSNGSEEISLFQKDIYSPNLITQVGNYLFVPDYDAEYYFEKAYILNMENGNIETWELEDSIYFDSTVLGTYDNDLYLVDKHEKKEWKINVDKKTMEQVGSEAKGGITYESGFINVTMNRLIYQDSTFKGIYPISYSTQNGLEYVFDEYRIKLLEEIPKYIISYNEDWVYYLKEDTLYAYSLEYGEIPLMEYFEWNFNYSNVIFLN
mgnify:FL=1